MNVWRQWIFPILRILLVGAIAVALVKIAFFPDREEQTPDFPTGEITNPTVTVTRGSVYNNVTVQGTISAIAPSKVRATGSGVIAEIQRGNGKSVKKGQAILVIKEERFTEKGTSTVWHTVKAPQTGKLALTVIKGQTVAVGDELGGVDRQRFRVSASVGAEMLYRLLDMPDTGTVSIFSGPAPFECTGLKLASTEGGTEVSCNVPSDVRVFSGLMAEISIPAGQAEDVLVLPTTAVEGAADFGNVYVVLPDGSTEVREVTLGLNDGMMVEITGGLSEGETVLQFVPGANANPEYPIDPGFPVEPGRPIDPGVPEPMPEPMPGVGEAPVEEVCTVDNSGNTTCYEPGMMVR